MGISPGRFKLNIHSGEATVHRAVLIFMQEHTCACYDIYIYMWIKNMTPLTNFMSSVFYTGCLHIIMLHTHTYIYIHICMHMHICIHGFYWSQNVLYCTIQVIRFWNEDGYIHLTCFDDSWIRHTSATTSNYNNNSNKIIMILIALMMLKNKASN